MLLLCIINNTTWLGVVMSPGVKDYVSYKAQKPHTPTHIPLYTSYTGFQCDSTSTHSPSSSYLFRSPHFQTFASSTRLPFQPWSHLTPSMSYLKCRPFHTSSGNWEDKSVIEHAVDQMKEKKKQVELAKVWTLGGTMAIIK